MAILINDTAPRAQYTATSGQTVFTVSFEFFVNSDLKVYRNSTLLTLTTDYTVTGAGVTGGGSVTFVTGATAGDIVTIVRDVPVARTSDFPTSGPFNIEALNTDLDRLTAMVQQQETLDGRSLRLDQFDTPNTLNVLPVKASRVGRVLQFNSSTGQPEAGPTTSEIANAQTYATNASTSATAAAASAATASSAAASTAGSVAAAAASASAASTSASNASTSASNASTSATNAASSASTATTQATNSAASAALANDWATKTSGAVAGGEFSAKYHAQAAATSASNASTSASNAASSASSASAAQTAAESARDATLAAYDSFDDRYLGAKASDPSVDNDGNALVAGALYFNTTDGVMKLYTGSSWVAAYVSGAGFLALSGGTMTGTVNFVAGSAAAPGIAASGDTNTGIFFPAADTIAFAEGGTEALRINSSAQVVTTAGTVSLPAITTTGDLNTGIFFPVADTIAFAEGGAEVMRLDSSGNVGIGTSSPAASLSVVKQTTALSGTGNAYGLYMYPTSSGLTYIDSITSSTGNTSLGFRTYNNGTYNEMRMDSSGNVGIGTSSPGYKMSVNGDIYTQTTNGNVSLTQGATTNSGYVAFWNADRSVRSGYIGYATLAGSGTFVVSSDISTNSMIFQTNAAERFRIGTSGQLGIGGANYGTSGQALVSNGSGAAPSWQAPIPDIYTGSTQSNTSYPIGTTVLIVAEGTTSLLNSSSTLYYHTVQTERFYKNSGAQRVAITGTWRARGYLDSDGSNGQLFQRTA